MTAFKSDFLNILQERGFIHQCSDVEGLDALEPHEIEASFVSLFNNGFSDQDFPASLILQHVPELRFRPITRYSML